VTLVLTTHDMVEADRLCARIAIMDHGRVIALDTPQALRRLLPAEHGLDLVLEGGDDPAAAFGALNGGVRVETSAEGEGRWRVRLSGDGVDEGIAERALGVAREAGRPLVELRRIEGTLEDVFVHLTGRGLR
jgi:ABC-2 type transport system ATP-binding protein